MVAALHPQVGAQGVEDRTRVVGLERDDPVDTLQRGQRRDPVREGRRRAGAPPGRRVGVHEHEQAVAESAGGGEALGVAAVQRVEHPAGRHHRPARRTDPRDQGAGRVEVGDRRRPSNRPGTPRDCRLAPGVADPPDRRSPAARHELGGAGDRIGHRLVDGRAGGEPGGDPAGEVVAGPARVGLGHGGCRGGRAGTVAVPHHRAAAAERDGDGADVPAGDQVRAQGEGRVHPGTRDVDAGRTAGLGQVRRHHRGARDRPRTARVRIPHHRHPAGRGPGERGAHHRVGRDPAAVVGHEHRAGARERPVQGVGDGRAEAVGRAAGPAVRAQQRPPAGPPAALDDGAAGRRPGDERQRAVEQSAQALSRLVGLQRGDQPHRHAAPGHQRGGQPGAAGPRHLRGDGEHRRGGVGAEPVDGALDVDVEQRVADHDDGPRRPHAGPRRRHAASR